MTEFMIFIWVIGTAFTFGLTEMLNKSEVEDNGWVVIPMAMFSFFLWPYWLGIGITKLKLTQERYK